ncbi:MAG: grasp-with-spasm system ATP-grasp peptide maturase [Bacteroidales bacterium]|jgi:ATP-GRASP peptide maturase of grasp-with-spasm system|nr:grasp-with-spasm system ATP-grasp peptide maturase [Bacteroidales bacterium]
MKTKNKILILTGNKDISSTNVMKWLFYLDKSITVIRLNTDELFENYNIKQECIEAPIIFKKDGFSFSTDEISVVWSWKLYRSLPDLEKSKKISISSLNKINNNIKNEQNVFFQYFLYNLDNYNCYWLNRFTLNELNKLEQLQVAHKIGLKIPHTFLKTKLEIADLKSSIITKPMSEVIHINLGERSYSTFTSRVNEKNIKSDYTISLFQEEIEKELELRVFYLGNKCYTVAILSQFDTQTTIDFRNYNYSKPNKMAFYDLPTEITKKINLFMEHFNLQMGSLDFILDKKGNYVFLEVNPSGQYGFFDYCNIYPDKLIAEYLLKKYYEYNK